MSATSGESSEQTLLNDFVVMVERDLTRMQASSHAIPGDNVPSANDSAWNFVYSEPVKVFDNCSIGTYLVPGGYNRDIPIFITRQYEFDLSANGSASKIPRNSLTGILSEINVIWINIGAKLYLLEYNDQSVEYKVHEILYDGIADMIVSVTLHSADDADKAEIMPLRENELGAMRNSECSMYKLIVANTLETLQYYIVYSDTIESVTLSKFEPAHNENFLVLDVKSSKACTEDGNVYNRLLMGASDGNLYELIVENYVYSWYNNILSPDVHKKFRYNYEKKLVWKLLNIWDLHFLCNKYLFSGIDRGYFRIGIKNNYVYTITRNAIMNIFHLSDQGIKPVKVAWDLSAIPGIGDKGLEVVDMFTSHDSCYLSILFSNGSRGYINADTVSSGIKFYHRKSPSENFNAHAAYIDESHEFSIFAGSNGRVTAVVRDIQWCQDCGNEIPTTVSCHEYVKGEYINVLNVGSVNDPVIYIKTVKRSKYQKEVFLVSPTRIYSLYHEHPVAVLGRLMMRSELGLSRFKEHYGRTGRTIFNSMFLQLCDYAENPSNFDLSSKIESNIHTIISPESIHNDYIIPALYGFKNVIGCVLHEIWKNKIITRRCDSAAESSDVSIKLQVHLRKNKSLKYYQVFHSLLKNLDKLFEDNYRIKDFVDHNAEFKLYQQKIRLLLQRLDEIFNLLAFIGHDKFNSLLEAQVTGFTEHLIKKGEREIYLKELLCDPSIIRDIRASLVYIMGNMRTDRTELGCKNIDDLGALKTVYFTSVDKESAYFIRKLSDEAIGEEEQKTNREKCTHSWSSSDEDITWILVYCKNLAVRKNLSNQFIIDMYLMSSRKQARNQDDRHLQLLKPVYNGLLHFILHNREVGDIVGALEYVLRYPLDSRNDAHKLLIEVLFDNLYAFYENELKDGKKILARLNHRMLEMKIAQCIDSDGTEENVTLLWSYYMHNEMYVEAAKHMYNTASVEKHIGAAKRYFDKAYASVEKTFNKFQIEFETLLNNIIDDRQCAIYQEYRDKFESYKRCDDLFDVLVKECWDSHLSWESYEQQLVASHEGVATDDIACRQKTFNLHPKVLAIVIICSLPLEAVTIQSQVCHLGNICRDMISETLSVDNDANDSDTWLNIINEVDDIASTHELLRGLRYIGEKLYNLEDHADPCIKDYVRHRLEVLYANPLEHILEVLVNKCHKVYEETTSNEEFCKQLCYVVSRCVKNHLHVERLELMKSLDRLWENSGGQSNGFKYFIKKLAVLAMDDWYVNDRESFCRRGEYKLIRQWLDKFTRATIFDQHTADIVKTLRDVGKNMM